MFSPASFGALSPAMNPATQAMGDLATLPVVFHVGNVDASRGSRPREPTEPVTDIDGPGEAGVSADALQVSGNLRLRAAVAYGEVMRLLSNGSIGVLVRTLLEMIARDLKKGIRAGCGPSLNTLNNLYVARDAFHWEGALYEALCRAIRVISDNENPSLDEIPDARLHLAHVVEWAVSAEDALSDSQHGSSGSAEVIGRLAVCVKLDDALHYLNQPMDSMSPAGEFRQRLGFARTYLQECFSNPEFKPNRFPVDPPWKSAIDRFYC
jgi:hypothetical protein